ncbi:SseB family protein [Microcella daejeonensis]|uniref:SseB family protein n=1 Tax=Microcella daejeonensis TaxID=2994971 RepID=UPI0022720EBF|nr:SseB family protein [Microcella daejeonensis]WAB83657.1 SseB family protein [Microcella daejeonensis]
MPGHAHGHEADSAGQPWVGRSFTPNPAASDDGSAPGAFLAAMAAFRAGETGLAAVVDAVRASRFLIPLVAVAGEEGLTEEGLRVDKTQELSIITVSGPDGRPILPVFSSVAAMARWRADARPVPADARRVALAAASEQTDRVVIDATSDDTEVVLPRPAVWAIARGAEWTPALDDAEVLEAIAGPAEEHPEIIAVAPVAGDPGARGAGAEVVVRLAVAAGTSPERLRAVLSAIGERWSQDAMVAERVDSLSIQPVVLPTEGGAEQDPA